MDCSCFELNQIVKITHKELVYCEDRGDLISIDLQMCRNRYLKYLNSHLEDHPERNGIPVEDDENFRCVGDRFFDKSGSSFFEFYDWPHIKFELRLKRKLLSKIISFIGFNWESNYYNQFYNIQKQLQDVGWQTYDLG